MRAGARAWARAWVALALFLAREAKAEPFDPGGRDWEGYADFAEIARAKLGDDFVVASRIDFDVVRSNDALILVHPEGRVDTGSISAFMAAGGRVVLIDDFGTGEGLLRRFGIRRVPTPARPSESLRRNPDLAIAEPIGSGLAQGLTRVVTNHATALEEPTLTPFLEIRSETGAPAVIGMVGLVSSGALVVVGDPSALMNSMLRYRGNRKLGENLVAWSSNGPNGRRSGKVYFASGAFDERGTFAASSEGTLPSSEPLAAELFFGSSSLGPRAAHLLAALLGLGVVVWIGSRAGRTYRIVEPRLLRRVPLLAQGGSAGRAAALGARHAPRDRALLEIGKALEEDLALALGLDRVPTHDALLQRLGVSQRLDGESLETVRNLLARVAHIDTLSRAGRTHALRRVSDGEVLLAAKVALRVLERVHANARPGRAA
jgi:hypothetical protein